MSYLPVRVSTLKSQVALGFDIYIKLPHKVLLYARGDDDVEQVRLDSLKKKKVRKLFINDDDEAKYQGYIDRCLAEAMNDDSVSVDEKAELVMGAGEAAAERIYEDPTSKKSYDAAESTATNLISVLAQNDELLKGIFDKAIDDDEGNIDRDARMQKHSVKTSSLCISFGEFLKLPKEDVEFLGVAGLFHDVAYSQYDDEEKGLFFKEMDDMEAPEKVRYKEHPKVGLGILEDKDFANARVKHFISIHEEKQNGNGFPNKVKKLELAEEVMSICAFYDREVTCLGKSRDDVLTDFSQNQIGNYDLEIIKKFKTFVKKAGL